VDPAVNASRNNVEIGKRGLRGKEGAEEVKSAESAVSSEQRRKTRRNIGVAMAVSGFDGHIHLPRA
jgi:hypothetical protein